MSYSYLYPPSAALSFLLISLILFLQTPARAEYERKETIIMPNWEFYNDNDQALRMPAVETRDSLGVLAALIVAHNHDWSNPNYDEMVIDLYDTVKKLQYSYESRHISDG